MIIQITNARGFLRLSKQNPTNGYNREAWRTYYGSPSNASIKTKFSGGLLLEPGLNRRKWKRNKVSKTKRRM